MAVKKEIVRTGWREAVGILLLAGCAIGILSVYSFDPGDIALLKNPPNDPAVTFIGPVGAMFGFLTFMTLGVCGYLFPAGLAYIGLLCLFKREGRVWPKAVWMLALLLSLAVIVELQGGAWTTLQRHLNVGSAGGMAGHLIGTRLLVSLMGTVGTGILAVAVMLISLVLLFDIKPVLVGRQAWDYLKGALERLEIWRRSRLDKLEQLAEEERDVAKRRRRLEQAIGDTSPKVSPAKEKAKPAPVEEPEEDEEAAAAAAAKEAWRERALAEQKRNLEAKEAKAAAKVVPEPEPVLPVVAPEPEPEPARASTKVAKDDEVEAAPPALVEKAVELVKSVRAKQRAALKAEMDGDAGTVAASSPGVLPPMSGNFTLPPVSLLDPAPPEKDREVLKGDFASSAQVLKETMAEFGIDVEVTNVERGPVVTRYELLPAPGVRVERIAALSNNIGLAMKAESVRVQAPIPGKGVVGIEVPNMKTMAVYARDIVDSPDWTNTKCALPLMLGKDVGGRALIADLADMPHMLIAGATGSGKTVCMNSILAGLLMARSPEQMRLMLIDPKIVEFAGYANLPHLVVPVITDSKKVTLGLRWAINEMEKRYKLFAKVGVRNIKAFNSRPIVKQTELFAEPAEGDEEGLPPPPPPETEQIPDRVPYIVIVVDELADLMLVAQADIENQIARLAQLSRAVGIHMILATQRPSVNVITGTIKANFPARISFQVAQKVDSRTILDAAGADKLLGKGDMLFLPPGTGKLTRAQGTLTTDAELHRIVDHWRAQGVPQYEMAIKDKIEGKQVDIPDMEEDDELVEAAMEIIRQTRRASTSSLQRRLRIGYTRAARIMDLLEQRGIVGPAQGSDPREILIDLDGEVPSNEAERTEP